MRLWHFTCGEHGHAGIGTRGLVIPQIEHPLTGLRVSWFTSEARPDRERTGLSMSFTPCDRMAYRYRVSDATDCVFWLHSPERVRVDAITLADLETYGDVEHWWIASTPVPVVLS